MAAEALTLEPTAAIRAWQAGSLASRVRGRAVQVPVARIQAIAYKEIVELVLARAGARSVRWRDARGEQAPGAGVAGNLARLARDALALAPAYLRHALTARRILADPGTVAWHAVRESALYLRMDHNFDLHGGGSVAHTAGIINSFRALLPELTVLSSDGLPLVTRDARFHELTPRYGAGRNVPGLPLFDYSAQMVAWVRRHLAAAPGFVYARCSPGNHAGPQLRRLLERPYVCEYNGSIAWIARNWGERRLRFERLFDAVERSNLRAADLVIAVSAASRDELLGRGIAPERVLVNPNGVDPDCFHPDLDGRAVRARHGIGDDERVVGFIGTFGPWHGCEVLARAFVRLLGELPPAARTRWRLLLIGDGARMAAVREVLRAGDAIDRSVFTGVIEQSRAPQHLAACDVLASPHVPNPDGSPFFGSPTKLFEYMAMGRAIVASALDQIGEVLHEGRTALLVAPGEPQALCAALSRLGEDPALRARLGAAAREEVLRRYTWRQHSTRILDALEARCPAP